MVTINLPADQCYETIGTLDIETSGFDGVTEDLIAIGVGYYERGQDTVDVEVHTQLRCDGDECELIRRAYDWLHDRDPEALATFNGAGFDFDFLVDKCDALDFVDRPDILGWPDHIDLLALRKQVMPPSKQWPSLEDCLDAYQIPECETTWDGGKLTNTRFGEEFAPEYIRALQNDETSVLADLEAIVHEYTETDIEATLALYEHDAGREYTPTYAR